jgi:hypothetical protein
MLSEETKTLVTTLRHMILVAKGLHKLAACVASRAVGHDASKLSIEQFARFVEINRIAREHKYGSPEYNASLETNRDAIGKHYRRNSHHPEHHENGVDGMGLADFIEMVVDWEVAAQVYGNATFDEGLAIQTERFNLDERHLYLIGLIREELKTP